MIRSIRNHKGYSFVEMIIVIAIIIVLSAMALVSLTIINSARAKDAAINTGEEINTLKQKCMNMTPDDLDADGKPVGNYDGWALAMYRTSDDKVAICLTKHVSASAPDTNLASVLNTYVPVEYNATSTYGTVNTDDDLENSENNIVFSKRVDVLDPSGNSITTTPIYISFGKRGNCISGSGEYHFHKANGNQVARVKVNDDGSVLIK